MSDLLSGLGSLGLGSLQGMELFEDNKKETSVEEGVTEVVIDERLIELHMGSVQGKTIDECSAEELEVAFENPEKNGGESLKDLCERVVAVYEEVEKLNKNVLIVAHGAVYRALYRYLNNIEGYALDVDTPPNATIIELKKAR